MVLAGRALDGVTILSTPGPVDAFRSSARAPNKSDLAINKSTERRAAAAADSYLPEINKG